jgi:hypothetical protein
MKKIVILILVVVATIGQVLAQATREQIAVADREISRAEVDFKKAERDFKSQKAKQLANLNRSSKKWMNVHERSESKTEISTAKDSIESLQHRIDSVSALTADANMYAKQKSLQKYKDERTKLLAQFLEIKSSEKTVVTNSADTTKLAKAEPAAKPAKATKEKADIYDRKIPTEVNRIDYKQRGRSYDLRRDDLVLTKIEQNINSAISPGGQEGGYKVIFDNQYVEPVNFVLRSINGSARKAIMVSPGIRQTKYLFPGKYVVEFYVNGRLSGAPRPLTIDGQTSDYQGETCFGFVYMPRFAN